MAISVIGTTVSPLTDDLATRFKELPRMNNDRAIEKSRIANHLRAIKAGEFLNNLEWAEVECAEDGVTYRANGQHTSHLLVWMRMCRNVEIIPPDIADITGWTSSADVPDMLTNQVVITKWKCDTLDELPVIFSQYDPSTAARHASDRLAVHAGLYPELRMVPGHTLRQLVGAINAYAKEVATKGDAVLGVEGFKPSPGHSPQLTLTHDSVRAFMVWFLDLPDELRDFLKNRVLGAFAVQVYEERGDDEAKRIFEQIIKDDDEQDGPGYDLMNIVRKQLDRKQKKQAPDKVLRALNRQTAGVIAEVASL